jgi:hypothetical protein
MPTNLSTFLTYNISTSESRTVTRAVATNGQLSFSVNYKVGYIDVFLNGSKLDSTEYTASDGSTVTLSEAAVVNDIVEFVTYNTVIPVGISIINDTSTNSSQNLLFTPASSGGISSISVSQTQLNYNPSSNTLALGNIGISGIGTVSQLRIGNSSQKLTRVAGNNVSIIFNSGGGNIGYCTNPTGNIAVNVTQIPTDGSFDNQSISFSVIINQTGTARSCTSVTLNGVSRPITWKGGSLAASILGVTTSRGYDFYNFVGINTVGSASTTSNYQVLGFVSG